MKPMVYRWAPVVISCFCCYFAPVRTVGSAGGGGGGGVNHGDDGWMVGWQVNYGNEFFMVNRAFKAIRRADVVLLMVDVEAGITDQVRYPLYPLLPTPGKMYAS